jgi:hypothetical protein
MIKQLESYRNYILFPTEARGQYSCQVQCAMYVERAMLGQRWLVTYRG